MTPGRDEPKECLRWWLRSGTHPHIIFFLLPREIMKHNVNLFLHATYFSMTGGKVHQASFISGIDVSRCRKRRH